MYIAKDYSYLLGKVIGINNDLLKIHFKLYEGLVDATNVAFTQLDKAKKGTRLVTYHGNNFEVPNSYKKENEAFNGTLKLWVKQH